MKVCINSKVYDAQLHEGRLVVVCNGKVVMPEARAYDAVYAEFKRLEENAKYAAAYGPDF